MLVMCASMLVKVLNHNSEIFYDNLGVNPVDELGTKGHILVKQCDILQCTHIYICFSCDHPSYLYFNDISQSKRSNEYYTYNLLRARS